MLVSLLYLLHNHFCDRFSAFDVYGLIFVGLIVLCVKDTVRVFKFVDANCRCVKTNCILRGFSFLLVVEREFCDPYQHEFISISGRT
jgi:hypothetical protein